VVEAADSRGAVAAGVVAAAGAVDNEEVRCHAGSESMGVLLQQLRR
jgi:hypothetical protein